MKARCVSQALVAIALVGAVWLPSSASAQEWAVGDIQLSAGPVNGPVSCEELARVDSSLVSPWTVDVTASAPPHENQAQYYLSYRLKQGDSPWSGWTSDASPSSQASGWLPPSTSRQTVTIRTPVGPDVMYEMRLVLGIPPDPITSNTISVTGPPGFACTGLPVPGAENSPRAPERPTVKWSTDKRKRTVTAISYIGRDTPNTSFKIAAGRFGADMSKSGNCKIDTKKTKVICVIGVSRGAWVVSVTARDGALASPPRYKLFRF